MGRFRPIGASYGGAWWSMSLAGSSPTRVEDAAARSHSQSIALAPFFLVLCEPLVRDLAVPVTSQVGVDLADHGINARTVIVVGE